MNVLVLYQSRSGHTRRAAEAIGEAARALKGEAVVKSVIEVGEADVARADVLFVGTWVQGLILFAVKPAGAELWVPALPPLGVKVKRATGGLTAGIKMATPLGGKPVGVFCTYAFHPRGSLRALGAMLTGRGATVVGERAFHRSRPGAGAEAFVRGVLEAAQGVGA